MIGKLSGQVDSLGEDWVIIDVGGVGYLVFCSARTLSDLPASGGSVRLFVDTHVREDHIHLYGFALEEERRWFRLLQSVQGVGARVALAILSVLEPPRLAQAIASKDRNAISRANGVGGKLAGRIVSELRDSSGPAASVPFAGSGMAVVIAAGSPESDAVSALVNLGYRRGEATAAVAAASRKSGSDAKVEALIRGGLSELGR